MIRNMYKHNYYCYYPVNDINYRYNTYSISNGPVITLDGGGRVSPSKGAFCIKFYSSIGLSLEQLQQVQHSIFINRRYMFLMTDSRNEQQDLKYLWVIL